MKWGGLVESSSRNCKHIILHIWTYACGFLPSVFCLPSAQLMDWPSDSFVCRLICALLNRQFRLFVFAPDITCQSVGRSVVPSPIIQRFQQSQTQTHIHTKSRVSALCRLAYQPAMLFLNDCRLYIHTHVCIYCI